MSTLEDLEKRVGVLEDAIGGLFRILPPGYELRFTSLPIPPMEFISQDGVETKEAIIVVTLEKTKQPKKEPT